MIFRSFDSIKILPIKNTVSAGFTLVELMVTVALFGIMTSIIVSKNSDFNSSILLTNLAYETALTIRQAQVYGLNVKQSDSGDAAFKAGYGVHFDVISDNSKKFILFADKNNNKFYDSGIDSVIEEYSIGRGNYIKRICLTFAAFGIYVCSDSSSQTPVASIVFTRPEPDAVIKAGPNGHLATKVEIVLASATNSKRKVVVNNFGAISVENCATVQDQACQ